MLISKFHSWQARLLGSTLHRKKANILDKIYSIKFGRFLWIFFQIFVFPIFFLPSGSSISSMLESTWCYSVSQGCMISRDLSSSWWSFLLLWPTYWYSHQVISDIVFSSSRTAILFFFKNIICISLKIPSLFIYCILFLVRFFTTFVICILKSLFISPSICTDLWQRWHRRAVGKGWSLQGKALSQLASYMKNIYPCSTSPIHTVSRSKCSKANSIFLEGNTGECPCRQWFLKQDSNSSNHKGRLIN